MLDTYEHEKAVLKSFSLRTASSHYGVGEILLTGMLLLKLFKGALFSNFVAIDYKIGWNDL